MSKKSDAKPRPNRGGSDTAREKGLKGIVIHVSPEDYERGRAAMVAAGERSLKAFATVAFLEKIRENEKK